MKFIANLSKELEKIFQDIYERDAAIKDLCLMLASNNDLFQGNSDLYDRLIEDESKCKNEMKIFWNKCQDTYQVTLTPPEELYLNFYENALYIKNPSD